MKQKVKYQHQQEKREDTQKLNQSIKTKLKLEKEFIFLINGEKISSKSNQKLIKNINKLKKITSTKINFYLQHLSQGSKKVK